MASIVKELDKVSGTTTRSHNIADAVSKLAGSGSSNGGLTIVNVVADGSADAPPVVRSVDKKPDEIIAAIEAGDYVIARVVINYSDASYPDLYFLNPPKQASFPDDESSKTLLFSSEDCKLMIPRDESLPARLLVLVASDSGNDDGSE